MATNLITVNGRTLETPTPQYHAKTNRLVRQQSNWDLNGIKFIDAVPLEKWSCLNIQQGSQLDPKDPASHYVTAFVKELNNCGIKCRQPTIEHMLQDDINTIPGAISEMANRFKRFSEPKKGIRFLLVILPRKSPELYNHIKRLGDQEYGILTCCIVATNDKFFNPKGNLAVQYNANVALKVNLKLGGVNHLLEQGQLHKIGKLENKTMVIGIDVTHPSVGSSEDAPSIAAMVASDKRLAQWPADLRINKSRQEMVGKLRSMLVSRLSWWQGKYGDLPDNLLIYRDGVSEGQYQTVLDEEMPQIREACIEKYGVDYKPTLKPRISLIVVRKRHHTRFIRKGKDGNIDTGFQGKASNPEPGTVSKNPRIRVCRIAWPCEAKVDRVERCHERRAGLRVSNHSQHSLTLQPTQKC